MRTAAHRRHYAAKFNTPDDYVKYWAELSPAQQLQAEKTFGNYDMTNYVYQIGVQDWVVSRRLLLSGDEPYKP